MTSSRGSNGYDWSQPPDPSSVALWIAEHRTVMRVVVLIVDAVLLAVLVGGLFTGENRWYQYLQLPVWACLTANFGWLMPKSVDDWRRRKLDPIE